MKDQYLFPVDTICLRAFFWCAHRMCFVWFCERSPTQRQHYYTQGNVQKLHKHFETTLFASFVKCLILFNKKCQEILYWCSKKCVLLSMIFHQPASKATNTGGQSDRSFRVFSEMILRWEGVRVVWYQM